MLIVFSPIFMVGTKIIFQYDFVAPLILEVKFRDDLLQEKEMWLKP